VVILEVLQSLSFYCLRRKKGDAEIIVTTLFHNLKLLAPETSYVNIEFENKKKVFLFQSDIDKEFLERNNLREHPLISGGMKRSYEFPGKINKAFINKNLDNIDYLVDIISNFNNFYYLAAKVRKKNNLNETGNFPIHLLSKNNHSIYQLHKFESLMNLTNSQHGNSLDDRVFYFDQIKDSYTQIYYDGESSILDETLVIKENLNTNIDINVLNETYKEILNIDKNKFILELKSKGLNINESDVQFIFEKIKKNFLILKDFYENSNQEYKADYNKDNFIEIFSKLSHGSKTYKNLIFTFGKPSKFEICHIRNEKEINCKNENDKELFINIFKKDKENLKKFFQSNFNINDLSDIDIFYISKKNLFKEDLGISNSRYGINSPKWLNIEIDTNIILNYHENLNDIQIDYQKKEINIIHNQDILNELPLIVITKNYEINDEVLFDNWSIKLDYNIKDVETNKVDFKSGITGCLTILDLSIKNLVIESDNAICEDSINFHSLEWNY
jgi:hypothetical protein